MSNGESIIISLMLFILSVITFFNSIDGNGIFNFGEAIGFAGILIFFFLTLAFLMDNSQNQRGAK